MRPSWLARALVAFAPAAAFAQAPAAPVFDAASVKPNPDGPGDSTRSQHGGSLRMINMTLRADIAYAYGVTLPQVVGPDWLDSERYDIVAKTLSPDLTAKMRIPLVAGRAFTRADNQTAPPVAIVNESMVAQYWRGRNPVGSRLQVKGRWLQVVGVARMSKYSNLTEVARPFFYIPIRQSQGLLAPALQIRTTLPPQTMARALVAQIHALDANLAPGEVVTMQEMIDRTTAVQRVAVAMLGVFGGLALALAAIGIYGVMSYTVSQSRRELGLRMALGAGASTVLRLVLSHGLALTAGGLAVGALAALASTRLLGNLLYKVSPRDPLAFGAALLVMAVASAAACFLPAWRATRTDPVRALRS